MKTSRPRRRALAALASLGLASAHRPLAHAAGAASDDAWPSRPIRLVVGTAPGGGDIVPRLFATRLAAALGQPVVVENRPGASYNIASEIVARAPADGYTLLWATSQITLTPAILGRSVVVDPVAAFAPITKVFATPVILFVHRSLGVATLGELLDLARREPGRLSYATTGIGTLPHLVMETILGRAGVALPMVPYSNASQLLADFTQGEIAVYPSFYVAVRAALQGGNVRGIAVAGTRRTASLPDLPTVVELGYPEAVVDPWAGFAAPAGTPASIVATLHREIVRIAQSPEIQARYAELGMDPVVSSPEGFAAEIRSQASGWPAIVKAAGLTPPP